jgi:hypothetical protein
MIGAAAVNFASVRFNVAAKAEMELDSSGDWPDIAGTLEMA